MHLWLGPQGDRDGTGEAEQVKPLLFSLRGKFVNRDRVYAIMYSHPCMQLRCKKDSKALRTSAREMGAVDRGRDWGCFGGKLLPVTRLFSLWAELTLLRKYFHKERNVRTARCEEPSSC